MSLRTIFYISRSLLALPRDRAQLLDIRVGAIARNMRLGVTGLLMATDRHFAQALEGSPDALDALMASIRADDRHTDMQVMRDEAIAERRFEGWAMAYFAPTSAPSVALRPAIVARAQGGADDTLLARLAALYPDRGRAQATLAR